MILSTNNNKLLISDEFLKPKLSSSNNEKYLDLNLKTEDYPFKIIGNLEKKSEFFGFFNYRYIEIDIITKLFKRFSSTKTYQNKPLEIIKISSIISIKKLLLDSSYYYFEIKFMKENKSIKTELYRTKHITSRNKWYEKLYEIWKNKIDDKMINNLKILFIDDQVGVIQEINKGDNKKPKGNISINDFHIISRIGNGGFALVYKVLYKKNNKIYAMKVMNKNIIIEKKYFHYMMTEYEILKLLNGNPFILNLYFCFQSANYLFMVLDYCSNGDLSSLKTISNAKLLISEILLAIEYMHEKNILYRDLKPENILLDSEGHIKICDFNLAKKIDTKNNCAYSFCGSPLYLSPEMVEKKGITFKSDVYQIGLIMYEIFTFQTAFKVDQLQILYDNISHNRINFFVNGINNNNRKLLEQILERKPQKRLSIKEIKENIFFNNINWNDVYNKKLGHIEVEKKVFNKKVILSLEQERNILLKIEDEIEKDTNISVLNGKITWKEMKKDFKRPMRNFVKQFYYDYNEENNNNSNIGKK